jgi:hypothetical protein
MPMNNRLLVPQKLPLLLDYAGGAAAAYSLRWLSNSYTGPVVRGRRGVDAAQRDFIPSEITDGTVAAWNGEVGSTGVSVTTWYDQSGNGNDAVQATSQYMPLLYSAATGLVTEGGKAAVRFDGGDDRLDVPSSTATFSFLHDGTKSAVFAVVNTEQADNTLGAVMANTGGSSSTHGIAIWSDDRTSLSRNLALNLSVVKGVAHQLVLQDIMNDAWALSQQNLMTVLFDVGNATATARAASFMNGASIESQNSQTESPSSSDASYDMQIGASGVSTFFWHGTMQELLIYPTDMTALRTRIEADMAWYY